VKQNSIAKFKDIITSVEFTTHDQDKIFEVFRCKLLLRDGSNLRILERYKGNKLIHYSYYWVSLLMTTIQIQVPEPLTKLYLRFGEKDIDYYTRLLNEF
jgi:hypothetical protein